MRRLPIARMACVAAVLGTVGCGSDREAADTTVAASPTTTIGGAVTVTTVATTTTLATTITAGGATTTLVPSTTTVGRNVTSPSDNVKLGDTGPGVEQVQAALKKAGYNIDVDGVFGPVTQKNVKDYQQKNDLTVDGVVGPKTWAKLSQAGSSGATTTTGG